VPLPRQRPTIDANATAATDDSNFANTDYDDDQAEDDTSAPAADTSATDSIAVATADSTAANQAAALPPVQVAAANPPPAQAAAVADAPPMQIASAADRPAPVKADATGALTSVASLIGANSIFALDGSDNNTEAQGDTNAGDETADTAPPANPHSGWRIQIAASPSKEGAEDMLDQALAKAGTVLAKADPYTEEVQSGESTLYRARFAGFSTKDKARAACVYLAKQKFSCLAVND
jgi:hypothetical protein